MSRISWSKELIQEKILELHNKGEKLTSRHVKNIDSKLHHAAGRYFGSWGKAVLGCGLEYTTGIKPNKIKIVGDTKEITVTNRFNEEFVVLVDKDAVIPSSVWISNKEYPRIVINGTKIMLHRYLYGEIKEGNVVDHINRNTFDCRLSNLREVSVLQNSHNKVTKGYTRHYSGKWHAYIYLDGGKQKSLGLFENETDASVAHKKACIKYRGEYAPKEYRKDHP
ncbi:HNH endonuclease [Bacillus phage 1_ICo-2020]|uniref:HNH endonuclease n=1 Tax=Bacillus phage 1_ICo-2020 TaxID=2759272 RepID=A0A7G8AKH2_9CAUD|nr:HNH endonuclease [Bacillus phage 1_ICo-2020]